MQHAQSSFVNSRRLCDSGVGSGASAGDGVAAAAFSRRSRSRRSASSSLASLRCLSSVLDPAVLSDLSVTVGFSTGGGGTPSTIACSHSSRPLNFNTPDYQHSLSRTPYETRLDILSAQVWVHRPAKPLLELHPDSYLLDRTDQAKREPHVKEYHGYNRGASAGSA